MVQLVPMTDEEYAAFLEHLIPDYAADQVRAGYWSESEALEKSREQTGQLLPDGLKTKDHYLYTIRVPEHAQAVGDLWLRATPDAPLPSGFIFDLEVHE